jgi:1,5-anhydro-D-fructose reductase (1,5-anhydro-D-mannitol-forming)
VTDSNAPTRFAIAGLGGHADVMARAIEQARDAVLVAGASTSANRADEFAHTHGVPGHDRYGQLLDRGDVDVLLIATANDRHAELTRQALAADLHVLCEKPMALTEQDALAMTAAADHHGRSLFVGYYLRFLEIVQVVRRQILDGAVGIPLDLRVQRYSQHSPGSVRPWRRDLSRAGAGVLSDVATHLTDLISYVTGDEIVTVHATARPPRSANIPEDHIVLTMTLAGGGIATVDAARGIAGGENDLHVHGSAGAICTGPLRWTDRHEAITTTANGQRDTESRPAGTPYVAEIEGVVAALHGAHSTVATGLDGIRGVQVLTAAVQSLQTGRAMPIRTTQLGG